VTNKSDLSYQQLVVGRFPTGMTGLEEMFDALCQEGCAPEEDLGTELVSRAREHNYIPDAAAQDYAQALLAAYRQHWQRVQAGEATSKPRQMWQGIPREQVPWFPLLDETLCDGCNKCLNFCPRGVFAKRQSGAVYVAQPMACMVGCDDCARLCHRRALTFPPQHLLRKLNA